MSALQEYRAETRAIRARLGAHCEQIGIRPPAVALRRYASLRWLESRWYLRAKMYDERTDLLDTLALRLRLDDLPAITPIVAPDLPDSLHKMSGPKCAPWAGQIVSAGMRDL